MARAQINLVTQGVWNPNIPEASPTSFPHLLNSRRKVLAIISIKVMLIKSFATVDAATLLELRDLINHMEHVADKCTDTTEYIRILATGETAV